MNLPNGRALGRQAVMFQAYSSACYQAFTKLTHKYTGEFGMRDVHYVDYRVALVGEITIRFFLILLKKHRSLFRIHMTFDTRLAPSRLFIPQPITGTNSPS